MGFTRGVMVRKITDIAKGIKPQFYKILIGSLASNFELRLS